LRVKKKNLIFYQSIAEITLILQLLNKYPFGSCVILITGGKHFLPLLEKLKVKQNFGVTIFEFNNLRLVNPFNILIMYLRFYHSKDSKILMNYSFEDAIFFTNCDDFVAPIFLSKCNIKKITYLNVYNFNFSTKKLNLTLKNKIKKTIIKILFINTKIKLDFYKIFSKQSSVKNIFIRSFFFLTEKKINEKKIIRENYLTSFFKLPVSNKFKKKIIYIDSGDEEMIGDEFKNVIYSIFKIAEQAKFHIIIKKPITENPSPSLSGYRKCSYILDQIPIELYDLNKVQCVFGFMSTALVKISEANPHTKVFSIVNLLSPEKIKEFQKIIYSFHAGLSCVPAKVNYPSNLSQVKNIIERKNI
jgi:hypothetical protein